jgi:hypothetical protein
VASISARFNVEEPEDDELEEEAAEVGEAGLSSESSPKNSVAPADFTV